MCQVASYRSDEVPLELATQMVELSQRVWPRDAEPMDEARVGLDLARSYKGPAEQAPMSYVLLENTEPVAIAYTFAREIDTLAGRMTILALAGVAVEESKRGRGLGRTVVRAALERVDRGAFTYSLFQTEPHNRCFYEKLGASLVDNKVVNSLAEPATDESPFWDELILRYPAGPGWPDGEIDLRGPGY